MRAGVGGEEKLIAETGARGECCSQQVCDLSEPLVYSSPG